jgi:hypothetical protein
MFHRDSKRPSALSRAIDRGGRLVRPDVPAMSDSLHLFGAFVHYLGQCATTNVCVRLQIAVHSCFSGFILFLIIYSCKHTSTLLLYFVRGVNEPFFSPPTRCPVNDALFNSISLSNVCYSITLPCELLYARTAGTWLHIALASVGRWLCESNWPVAGQHNCF